MTCESSQISSRKSPIFNWLLTHFVKIFNHFCSIYICEHCGGHFSWFWCVIAKDWLGFRSSGPGPGTIVGNEQRIGAEFGRTTTGTGGRTRAAKSRSSYFIIIYFIYYLSVNLKIVYWRILTLCDTWYCEVHRKRRGKAAILDLLIIFLHRISSSNGPKKWNFVCLWTSDCVFNQLSSSWAGPRSFVIDNCIFVQPSFDFRHFKYRHLSVSHIHLHQHRSCFYLHYRDRRPNRCYVSRL